MAAMDLHVSTKIQKALLTASQKKYKKKQKYTLQTDDFSLIRLALFENVVLSLWD